MKKVRIITDSGADFPAPIPANLTILPLTIRFGDEEFHDGVDITHEEFYHRLMAAKELPKTSLITPAAFAEAFDAAEAAGESVVAVILSSRLSGTFQSALMAAEGREDVYVVDSLNATLGELIQVQYALRLADAGMEAAEIAKTVLEAQKHARILGMTETLEYLHKGGRISGTVAFVGEALGIRPVLTVENGEVVMLGKARGPRNGNNYLVREVEKAKGVNFSMPFCLGYTGLSDALLQRYINDSRALWEGMTDTLPICSVGATIGTHVGPGAVVLAFYDNL